MRLFTSLKTIFARVKRVFSTPSFKTKFVRFLPCRICGPARLPKNVATFRVPFGCVPPWKKKMWTTFIETRSPNFKTFSAPTDLVRTRATKKFARRSSALSTSTAWFCRRAINPPETPIRVHSSKLWRRLVSNRGIGTNKTSHLLRSVAEMIRRYCVRLC